MRPSPRPRILKAAAARLRAVPGRIGLWPCLLLLSGFSGSAQWVTQSFTLKPGWNAIYLHVDASHTNLDALIPSASSPVAEVWRWQPKLSTLQFVDNPSNPLGLDSSGWIVWTAARGDTDTLQKWMANGAYLVRNNTASHFILAIKGKPVPPAYQWTTTGLNFIGFPTPPGTAPSFASFLTPAPGLDLSQMLQNSAQVFRYPGGESTNAPSPIAVLSTLAATTRVTRGEAFWVKGATNYYNRYYGPVEISLQNDAGIEFGDNLGTYSLRLKNRTATSRTVTLNLIDSETPPTGQAAIAGLPQLLVRGDRNTTTLAYPHSVLANHTVTLTPEGAVGSEQELVLGLNRTLMTAPAGSTYAGILQITDGDGLQQVDLPVSATVPNASGLWVGQAVVDQVGQYLKQYPKVDTNKTTLAAEIVRLGKTAHGAQLPGAAWLARETGTNRYYKAVACSLDGKHAVVAWDAGPGGLSVTSDHGTNWQSGASFPVGAFKAVACSADGSFMAAAGYGTNIFVSTNAGSGWAARATVRNWVGIACSADGRKLAAVVPGKKVYVSQDGGTTWTEKDENRNWSGVAMSEDGTKLVASVNPGQLHTSTDSGNTWIARDSSRQWYAVASSKDGTRLIGAVDNATVGGVFISTNSGVSWQATSLEARRWHAVACSTDGRRFGAVSYGGTNRIQLSDDGGTTWKGQSPTPNFIAIAMSGDGTRVFAPGHYSTIHILHRQFAHYEWEAATGLIRDVSGAYLTSVTNTAMAKVPSPVPLRLILHHNATTRTVNLLQRVFVGQGVNTTDTVVTHRQQLLDSAQLDSARRISAPHLPFSANNTFWSATANFTPGSVVTVTVPLDYNDHASNPFLHTFHPDHDNLDPGFKNVRPVGGESYGIDRNIRLTFASAGSDFRALTAGAYSRSGTYEETITLRGKAGATREFRTAGRFSLQRISPVTTLTTQ